MNQQKFREFVDRFQQSQQDMLSVKNADYTLTDDCLSNFFQVAEWLGLSPLQVWSVWMLKHVTAIGQFIQTGELKTESMDHRIIDTANYMILGAAIISECDRKKIPLGPPVKPHNKQPLLHAIQNLAAKFMESMKSENGVNFQDHNIRSVFNKRWTEFYDSVIDAAATL